MILGGLIYLSLLSPAQAQEAFATVDKLWEPDAAGRWKSITDATQMGIIGETEDVLLTKGMVLEQGQQVRAQLGMAEIELASGNTLRLEPGAELILVEPTLIEQLAGEVMYMVKGAFSVKFGTVHCTVEGTKFEVIGPNQVTALHAPGDNKTEIPDDASEGTISVQVLKGKVRVSTESGEVLLNREQRLLVDPDGTLGEPQKWSMCNLCGYHHVPH